MLWDCLQAKKGTQRKCRSVSNILSMPLRRHRLGENRPGATGRSQRPAAVGRAGPEESTFFPSHSARRASFQYGKNDTDLRGHGAGIRAAHSDSDSKLHLESVEVGYSDIFLEYSIHLTTRSICLQYSDIIYLEYVNPFPIPGIRVICLDSEYV